MGRLGNDRTVILKCHPKCSKKCCKGRKRQRKIPPSQYGCYMDTRPVDKEKARRTSLSYRSHIQRDCDLEIYNAKWRETYLFQIDEEEHQEIKPRPLSALEIEADLVYEELKFAIKNDESPSYCREDISQDKNNNHIKKIKITETPITLNNPKFNSYSNYNKEDYYSINLCFLGRPESMRYNLNKFKCSFGTLNLNSYRTWSDFFSYQPPLAHVNTSVESNPVIRRHDTSINLKEDNYITYDRPKAVNGFILKVQRIDKISNGKLSKLALGNSHFEKVRTYWEKVARGPKISPLAANKVTYVPPSDGIFGGKSYFIKSGKTVRKTINKCSYK